MLEECTRTSFNTHVIGGFMGMDSSTSSEQTGAALEAFVSSNLKRTWNTNKMDTLNLTKKTQIKKVAELLTFEPEVEEGHWLINVDCDTLGLKSSLEAMRVASESRRDAVWVFRVKYSKGIKGFPAYKELVDSAPCAQYWGTYIRREDIEWLLTQGRRNYLTMLKAEDRLIDYDLEGICHQPAINNVVHWFSKNYNRDIDKVFQLYRKISNEGWRAQGVTDKGGSTTARNNIRHQIGFASGSLDEWVIRTLQGVGDMEVTHAMWNLHGTRLRGKVLGILGGLIEVKQHLNLGDGYHSDWQLNWVDDQSERYTRYARDLRGYTDNWGNGTDPISLETLVRAVNKLEIARYWNTEADVLSWYYDVLLEPPETRGPKAVEKARKKREKSRKSARKATRKG